MEFWKLTKTVKIIYRLLKKKTQVSQTLELVLGFRFKGILITHSQAVEHAVCLLTGYKGQTWPQLDASASRKIPLQGNNNLAYPPGRGPVFPLARECLCVNEK